MDAKGLAAMLDGGDYPLRIDRALAEKAKTDGLVIVYGASDDLMEIKGAIYGEINCFGGGEVYLTKEGWLINKCGDDNCPYFNELKKTAAKIVAVWDNDGYSWTYDVNFPHEVFDVVEDDEKYCRGVVFFLADVAV